MEMMNDGVSTLYFYKYGKSVGLRASCRPQAMRPQIYTKHLPNPKSIPQIQVMLEFAPLPLPLRMLIGCSSQVCWSASDSDSPRSDAWIAARALSLEKRRKR